MTPEAKALRAAKKRSEGAEKFRERLARQNMGTEELDKAAKTLKENGVAAPTDQDTETNLENTIVKIDGHDVEPGHPDDISLDDLTGGR